MRMQKIRAASRVGIAAVVARLWACYAAEPQPQIDVVQSHVTENATGARVSEVKVNINPRNAATSAALKSELALLNTSKGMANPKIYSNSAHTIIGFNASTGRASYNINLIWLGDGGTCSVSQSLNSRVATLLKASGLGKPFNEDGLYLNDISEQTLYIAFRSDNAHEFFTFAVDIDKEGQLHLVPNSINTNSPQPK